MVELRAVAEFAERAEAIVAQLGEEISALAPGTSTDHVGATALPTGLTKGDIDIAISVSEEQFHPFVLMLRRRYEVAQPQNWTETYASFTVAGLGVPVGIQVAVAGSQDDFLVPLRDLMRSEPELLAAYTDCKERAAALDDRGYWEAKDRFLRDVFIRYLPWARPALGST
jgi:GrpB-like predicted nucleotidyltransferase (UPF0157 family)